MFVLFGVIGALLLSIAAPPFQGPDEPIHFQRADLLTFGQWIGARFTLGGEIAAGGPSDRAIVLAARPFEPLIGHSDVRLTAAQASAGAQVRWGQPQLSDFRAAAVYPPILYLPQSGVIAVGKATRATVVATLLWSRLVNGAVCILARTLAIAMATARMRPLLYTILLLPMSLALYATASHDGLILALTALSCASASRAAEEPGRFDNRHIALSSICLGLVVMAKAAYAPLCLVILAAPGKRSARLLGFAAALVAGIGWTWWMGAVVSAELANPGANSDEQARYLLAHLGDVVPLAAHTLGAMADNYVRGFIGILGWIDTPLPKPYYLAAIAALAAATFAGLGQPARGGGRLALFALAAVVLTSAATFAALYILWTPVGAPVVTGVQGRYFLPIAMAAALVWQAVATPAPSRRLVRPPSLAVLLFPALSVAAAADSVVRRYYENGFMPSVWG